MKVGLFAGLFITDPTVARIVECWKKYYLLGYFTADKIPDVSQIDLDRAVKYGILMCEAADGVTRYRMEPHVFYQFPDIGMRSSVESFTNFTKMEDQGPYTNDEVADQFVKHLIGIKQHCASTMVNKVNMLDIPLVEKQYLVENVDNVLGVMCHSFLTMIDGGVIGLPSFNLTARADVSDKEYLTANGEKYWDDTTAFNDNISLHELYHSKGH